MKTLKHWDIVNSINWSENCEQHRYYETAKRELMRRYSVETMEHFDNFVRAKYRELVQRLEQFAQDNNVGIPGEFSGDDSFDDMVNHVIGRGETFYNSVMENPELLNGMHFVESFSYCVPSKHDYKYLASDYHKEQAVECINDLARIVRENNPDADDLDTIKDIMARMLLIVAGNFSEATRGFPQSIYDRYYTFKSNDCHARFSNVISDCKVHLC